MTTLSLPHQDHRQKRNNPDWIVAERGTGLIVHHRFSTLEAAEAFIANHES